jgi:hypothetical protein
MARRAGPSSDNRHFPYPGRTKKTRQRRDRMRGLDVDGAQETTCGRRRPEGDQVTIRVTMCDQGPMLLSFPMSLQRMEYSFPDW